jgi:hypothetical protein
MHVCPTLLAAVGAIQVVLWAPPGPGGSDPLPGICWDRRVLRWYCRGLNGTAPAQHAGGRGFGALRLH